ncbi:hypothetical protein A2U01_0084871, partial [Trifolium medium]|nr:hypothetical protein [Trifolium medium]
MGCRFKVCCCKNIIDWINREGVAGRRNPLCRWQAGRWVGRFAATVANLQQGSSVDGRTAG